MNDKKIIRSSDHAFTKGKSCLTNLINFYDEDSGYCAFIFYDASQDPEKLKVGKYCLILHPSVSHLIMYV